MSIFGINYYQLFQEYLIFVNKGMPFKEMDFIETIVSVAEPNNFLSVICETYDR